jgi:hypothetical protein
MAVVLTDVSFAAVVGAVVVADGNVVPLESDVLMTVAVVLDFKLVFFEDDNNPCLLDLDLPSLIFLLHFSLTWLRFGLGLV